MTADNSMLQSIQTRITAVENAYVTRDQAIGTAETTYTSGETGAKVTLDNGYTHNEKAWNTALQTYWNSVASLKQTEDNSIAQANAAQTTAVGSDPSWHQHAIDQAYATMYGAIAAAYS